MARAISCLLLLFFLVSSNLAFSQYEKDTIYLKFEKNSGEEPYYRGVKSYSMKEKGIIFNLIPSGSLLLPEGKKADTLSIEKMDAYTILTIKGVEKRVKEFRRKTFKKSPESRDVKAYQFYNKNDIFETFLIEVINGRQFVIYPVIWRNQNIIE